MRNIVKEINGLVLIESFDSDITYSISITAQGFIVLHTNVILDWVTELGIILLLSKELDIDLTLIEVFSNSNITANKNSISKFLISLKDKIATGKHQFKQCA